MLRSDLFNRTKLAAPPDKPWALWTEPALVTMLPVQPNYTPCQRVRALIEEPATDNTNIVRLNLRFGNHVSLSCQTRI